MTQIEKVARGICRASAIDCGYPDDRLDKEVGDNWPSFLPEARAAIEALRVIDAHQMIGIPVEEFDGGIDSSSFTAGEVRAVWQAQIDVILKEKP
jgi:hypothetical protein